MDEMSFERLLSRAASGTRYPHTPSLRAGVLAAVAPAAARRAPARAWRPFVLAAACIVALAAAAVLAVPSSRSAVAEFFGVKGSKIEVAPTPAPGVTPTPLPTPAGITQSATPIAPADARAALGFAPPRPGGAGDPAGLYAVDYFRQIKVVVLHYDAYDLWIARPDEGGIFQKTLGTETRLDTPLVQGRTANWISGGSHIVTYIDAEGREAAGAQHAVARNTLIWRTNAAFYRLETDLPEAQAVALAESLP